MSEDEKPGVLARLLKARKESEVLTRQELRTLKIFQRGINQGVWFTFIGMGLVAWAILLARGWLSSRGVPF